MTTWHGRRAVLGVALALVSGVAAAQLRTLPSDARRGEMHHVQGMTVAVDGEAMQLSPGAQIRDADNRVVVPAALPPGALVKYARDAQGHVTRVWILTPQEAGQPDPRR